jgi:membrane protein
VQRIKTGAARIILGYEAHAPNRLTVVPVGLSFDARKKFRGRVLVSFGAPVGVSQYVALFREHPAKALHALTTAIQSAMECEVLHVERIDTAALARAVEAIHRGTLEHALWDQRALPAVSRAPGPDSRAVADAVERLRTRDPERVERLWQRILAYQAGLAAYRLRDDTVRTRLERTEERQRVAQSWQTLVGLPLFAYGAAVNFLPYYLPGWLAGRMSRRPTDYATIRLLVSVVAFPLFWTLETSLVGWVAGLRWAVAFFLSLPLGGVLAYRYLVGTGRLHHQLRFGALLLTRAQEARRLLAERREILEELERGRRDSPGAAKDMGPTPTRGAGGAHGHEHALDLLEHSRTGSTFPHPRRAPSPVGTPCRAMLAAPGTLRDMRKAWRLLRDTAGDWYADRAQRLGAALAFYTVFALAPGLVILIPLTGVFLGSRVAQERIVEQIESLIGRPGAEAIEATIVSAREGRASVTAVAVITLVFGLWWVFGELQDALNTIWGVTPPRGRGFLVLLRERFWSFTLVVGIGFLLLVSLAVSAWLAALGEFFAHRLPGPAVVLEALNFVISFGVITFLFGMIFKLLPDVSIAWRDVWLGAALTSLLFTLGKVVIGFYLGRITIGSAYGAAGSLVVILLWVYYSAQILFFGAEFTKVWARRRPADVMPTEAAVPLADREQGMAPRQRLGGRSSR